MGESETANSGIGAAKSARKKCLLAGYCNFNLEHFRFFFLSLLIFKIILSISKLNYSYVCVCQILVSPVMFRDSGFSCDE